MSERNIDGTDLGHSDKPNDRSAFEMKTYGSWIDGRQLSEGRPSDVLDPTGRGVAYRVIEADTHSVDTAVDVAQDAIDDRRWLKLDGRSRSGILLDVAERLQLRRDELVDMEIRNIGKIRREVETEFANVIASLRFYSHYCGDIRGESRQPQRDLLQLTLYEPAGVAAQITPWNAPLHLACYHVSAALAAGIAVVLKPAPFAVGTPIELVKTFEEAGVPPGVLNVVVGGAAQGQQLVAHRHVSRIAFTGSSSAASHITKVASEQPRQMLLELGGKSPNIIFEDADLDDAAQSAVAAMFRFQGQICTARSRVLVQDTIADELLERLISTLKGMRVGDPQLPSTDQGPLISEEAIERQEEGVARFLKRNGPANLLTGGHRVEVAGLEGGHFFEPTLFLATGPVSDIERTEWFGPILTARMFGSDSEAIDLANYGNSNLAATIWSSSLSRALSVAAMVKAGNVSINQVPVVYPELPFGGTGMSGFGRQMGSEVLREFYSNKKTISINHSTS